MDAAGYQANDGYLPPHNVFGNRFKTLFEKLPQERDLPAAPSAGYDIGLRP
ncbi:hypothetical protein N9L68_00235 [bacterium]|nr:hypothetical protein [bacterium]